MTELFASLGEIVGERIHVTLYLLAVFLLGGFLLIFTLRFFWKMTLERLRKLRRRDVQPPVDTESPLESPEALLEKKGLEAIEAHYTVTRRVVVPLFGGMVMVALCIPFLGNLPAAFVTVLAGAVTVLTGIAAKPALENLIAGLVASYSKVLNIGDTVLIDNIYGTVEDISPTHTTIKLWDWRRYVVPNSRILETSFLNYTLNDSFQWAYVELSLGYEADLEEVRLIATEIASSSSGFHAYEPPSLWVMEMRKDSIICWVAAWADTPALAWTLKSDIREGMARELRIRGIPTHGIRLVEDRERRMRPPPERPLDAAEVSGG